MIQGSFRDDAPRAVLTIVGEEDRTEVEFVIDTGFTGMLALPSHIIATVGATPEALRIIQLADGSERRAPFCMVQVEWYDGLLGVLATIIEDEPLIGIGLLREHHLHVEVTEGGEVVVEPL